MTMTERLDAAADEINLLLDAPRSRYKSSGRNHLMHPGHYFVNHSASGCAELARCTNARGGESDPLRTAGHVPPAHLAALMTAYIEGIHAAREAFWSTEKTTL